MRTTSAASLALAISLFAGALAGCAGDGGGAAHAPRETSGVNGPAGKLTVLTNRTDLVDDGTMDKYAAAFKLRYPGAEIAFEALTNYATDAQIRLTTGEAGDVLLIPGNIPNSQLPNYFEPLPDAMFDDMYFGDLMAYEGKRYGLATGVSTQGIIYNKRAFDKAGVDGVPKTLGELYAAADKLKAAGITPLYMNFGAQWPMKSWGEDSVWYASGNADYLSDMVGQDAPWQPGNEWGRMIGIARTFVARGYVERDLATNNWESSKDAVASGAAAMYYLGNWVIPQLVDAGAKPEDIGFFPMPYDDSRKLNAPLGPDWMIGVSKSSGNKPLAIAWINFFVKESGYVESSGFIPVDKTKEPTLPQLEEFMSYRPTFVESAAVDPSFGRIANKAEIDFYTGGYIQTLVTAKDLGRAFAELNARWKQGRAAIGE